MPDFCAAYGCSNQRNQKTKRLGIIFHSYPFLQQPSSSRLSKTSQKAAEESTHSWAHTPARGCVGPDLLNQLISDHQYALDPVMVKEKWFESQEKMEQLRQELRKAEDRERRQRQTVSSLLEDLKKNKMLTEEPEQKLVFYSELLVRHHYVCTYCVNQDHLELFFFYLRQGQRWVEQQSKRVSLFELHPPHNGSVWHYSDEDWKCVTSG